MPLHDDYAWGPVALLGQQPQYLYLPEDTSRLYHLVDGSWQRQRTGIAEHAIPDQFVQRLVLNSVHVSRPTADRNVTDRAPNVAHQIILAHNQNEL